uniref:Uncharacterized protein n=1 Tax=Mola mola TaxID=94237 RepID=A0A3Q3WI25_MOLML
MAATAAKSTTSFLSTSAATTAILSTSSSDGDNATTSRTTLMTVTITTNETNSNATTFPAAVTESLGMEMVLVPFGIITVIGLAPVGTLMGVHLLSCRLEKLRHQLMPMYNFDPAEEQDDLLEQELLDHGREGSLTGPNAKTLTTSQGTTQRPSRLVFTDVAKALNA